MDCRLTFHGLLYEPIPAGNIPLCGSDPFDTLQLAVNMDIHPSDSVGSD